MKPDNTLTKKSKRTVPHIYALLFAIIVVCTILTWILPAGQFDRVDDVVVAGTFHAVESTPVGLFQMFQLIHTGFCDAGGVIFFVFIAYASIAPAAPSTVWWPPCFACSRGRPVWSLSLCS